MIRPNASRSRLVGLIGLAMVASHSLAVAQTTAPKWEVPPDKGTFEFDNPQFKARLVFAPDGFGREIPLPFVFLKHKAITITAKLPEPGTFQVVSDNPDSTIEISYPRVTNKEAEVVFTNSKPLMTPDELDSRVAARIDSLVRSHHSAAAKNAEKLKPPTMEGFVRDYREKPPENEGKLRERYIQLKSVELGAKEIDDALNEFADEHPTWVAKAERDAWKNGTAKDRYFAFKRLLQWDEADKHLQSLGFESTVTAASGDSLLMPKFHGAYALMSGKSVEDREGRDAVRALTTDELARLRAALIVDARFQFFPKVDTGDGNGQWFHGQRVTCLGRGVSSVTLEGSLDAGKGDRVDWWQLTSYLPDKVRAILPDKPGLKAEIIEDRNVICLRVVGTEDRPISYTVEFRPLGEVKGSPVIIHESPANDSARFPF